jgi:hypothetical protein
MLSSRIKTVKAVNFFKAVRVHVMTGSVLVKAVRMLVKAGE